MPDSPTKLSRGITPLECKQRPDSSEVAETPIGTESFMKLRPVLNFSKIFNARTIQASANKFIEQMKPKEDVTPRTQDTETLKAPSTPGLVSHSPTLDMDITSPIVLEESKKLDQASKGKEGKEFIGDYKIGKLLGKGAYGSVKLGEHLKSGQKVAIKIIDKRMQKTEKAQLRIRREIEILQKVKHPNVMQCYGIYETERYFFLITEYCAQGELFDYVQKREALAECEAVDFFKQLLDGVEYLHDMGICHRDLKLENILLDEQNNIKIADFGLSVFYEDGQTLSTRCGSPHYMAPEILRAEKYSPVATDTWSLGVLFFGMINGFMPFDGKSDAELFVNIKNGEFVMNEEIEYTVDCYDFIKAMLEPDVTKRITLSEIREHILIRDQKKEIAIEIEEL